MSEKWGRAQTVAGPVLSIPYRSYWTDSDDKRHAEIRYAHFLPEKLAIEGDVTPEVRYRSIYEVMLYRSQLQLSGHFVQPDFESWTIAPEDVLWEDAFVSAGISDMRGIQSAITLKWENEALDFNPGIPTADVHRSGVSTPVPVSDSVAVASVYPFEIELHLNGSGALRFLPLGKHTSVDLHSGWPHPGFTGAFLPEEHNITDSGFGAHWEMLHLNRNYPQRWVGAQDQLTASAFGVDLVFPVDHYQQTTRSVKYGSLFILLTFLVFFFVEILNKKRIHPIQYLLVGFALVLFFSLLLALSEHLPFLPAYGIAAVGIIALAGSYVHAAIRSLPVTGTFTGLLVALYGFLYVLLQQEGYALLIGNLGLFLILAIIMFITRKVDWYAVGTGKEA